MRAYDRTLASELGFADPDKKEPKHDLACQYLATRGVDLVRVVNPIPVGYRDEFTNGKCSVERWLRTLAEFESPIVKGDGKYRTVVGFLDLVLEGVALVTERDRDRVFEMSVILAAEVKIKKVPVGDILRQISLYREFGHADAWVLATAYPISPLDTQSLRSSGIRHVFLGDKFEEWIAEQQSVSDFVPDVEI